MTRIEELRELAKHPVVDWANDLADHAEGVRRAMTHIHGGKWNVVVNHRAFHVMIVREFDQPI